MFIKYRGNKYLVTATEYTESVISEKMILYVRTGATVRTLSVIVPKIDTNVYLNEEEKAVITWLKRKLIAEIQAHLCMQVDVSKPNEVVPTLDIVGLKNYYKSLANASGLGEFEIATFEFDY